MLKAMLPNDSIEYDKNFPLPQSKARGASDYVQEDGPVPAIQNENLV